MSRVGSFTLSRSLSFLFLLVFVASCGSDGSAPVSTGPSAVAGSVESIFYAGVSVVDVTPPVGVPLAGYGGGPRRCDPADTDPSNYHTFLNPSEGILDPIYAKALVCASGDTKVVMLSLDLVAVVSEFVDLIFQYARDMGTTILKEHFMVHSSHTHSGPGAISGLKWWELIGADVLVPSVQHELAKKCAQAVFEAESNMVPARFGSASGDLPGVTKNRRADDSPNLTVDMVDEELGILRVDKADGTPMALVWNFAVHGTSLYSWNMNYSADFMGAASAKMEAALGIPALFANGAEGDIKPSKSGTAGIEALTPLVAQKAVEVFNGIETTSSVTLKSAYEVIPFGDAAIDFSLNRAFGSYSPLNYVQVMQALGWNPSFKIKLNSDWFENVFRFQAIRFNDTVIVSLPGEAIHQLGLEIKSDGKLLGFDKVYPFGLANGHMGYIATEVEYEIGGYEGIATFFGPKTGENVRNACAALMEKIKP
jgi:neutral ceramidase